MRAKISEDTEKEVQAVTDGEFRVPDHRVTFEDRVKALLRMANDEAIEVPHVDE